MGKSVPQIQRYMTCMPEVIAPDATIAEAQRLLAEGGFRHLPVVKNSQLVGLLSQADIRLVESLDGIDAERIPVADVMQSHPFKVPPDARLDDVCAEMATHKRGSAIVVDNGRVIGIFTEVDALRALNELLATRLAH